MKHLLTWKDYSSQEAHTILKLAKSLKLKNKIELENKYIALYFQKPSNRTRVSFEVGIKQLGAQVINLREEEIQLGKREPIQDVILVFSRYVDALMIRALKHDDVKELAQYSTIPIINGLCDKYHPCQAMADYLTISEHKDIKKAKIVYIGDGNNVCSSLINLGKLLDVNLHICTPPHHLPKEEVKNLSHNPLVAIKDADVVYTDTWLSMGENIDKTKKLNDFKNFKITNDLFKNAKEDAIFLHCMPIHYGEEVDKDIAHGINSKIIDQAENRLHAQKAILVSLLGDHL